VETVKAYAIAFPNKKITASGISQYLSETKGVNVGAYLIRRDDDARELIDKINESYDKTNYTANVPAFYPIDVDKFLKKNSDVSSLKQALTDRDQYYSSVVGLAGKLAETCNELNIKAHELELENNKLKEALKKKLNAEESKAVKAKDSQVKALKKALKDYVYPAAADMILVKCGFIDADDSIIDEKKFNAKTVKADSDIKTSNNSAENTMEAEDDVNHNAESDVVEEKNDAENDPIDNLLKGFD